MPIDLASPAQCSKVISEVIATANALDVARTQLARMEAIWLHNGVSTALSEGGAVFPATFNLTPLQVQLARNALDAAKTAIDGAISAGGQSNIDAVTRNLGVLTGGG
jgi:hypothetical protein